MFCFFGYYFWLIFDIVFYIFIKLYLCKHEKRWGRGHYVKTDIEKNIKWPLYGIIIYFILLFIPVANIFVFIFNICNICVNEYYFKQSVKDKFNNSYIIKNLKKEY